MSTFSDVLTEYINTKNIKVFPMAKYCGLDRSTMYKLISGKRNPPPRDILKKMILFMHLTPTEIQHLEEAWNVTRIGPEIYYKRKSVENFICHFPSHFSVSPDEFIFSSKIVQHNPDSDCIALTSMQQVNYFIHKIYLYEIFPIYMSGLNYTLWYYYDNIHSHYHNMNIFPCMILTSDSALLYTADGQSGIFYSNTAVIHMLQEIYDTYLEQCSQLFLATTFSPDNFSNVFRTVFEADETAPTFALQPEVCVTPFISESILRESFNYELPHSEEIFRNATAAFAGNMRRLTDSQTFVYFTADGLMQFAASGRTAEIPEIFYHRFTPEQRIQMLRGVEASCRNGSYRILQKPLNHIPSNLHLCIRGNIGTLIFQKFNGEVMLFTIQEYGLLETFLDYLQNMQESCFYTTEEAVAYVQDIICRLENGNLE